jgi:hypothetical protein
MVMINNLDKPIDTTEMFMTMQTIMAHSKEIVNRGSTLQKRRLKELLERTLKQLENDNV